ncbi:MAG: hypothetical protein A3A33_01040 [Candidatus Yanofskybacteria bacterium RIFCSPLOWO2_01_FULL_49_25]|uniref:Uncharacterized protein n=1 Tax=Candidatus Yanofskybacteria bacterium RIFCSPLOWO2_01_FULL_49_25 TaxID=1802701 RepID=A0A1F8GWS8_9BACT|nr:MAG: hypothetical protein A3A33_01040 [Candidatus Yanofskybacteria bacterium RIFCSPLOWO2_01_FULL_49_25]
MLKQKAIILGTNAMGSVPERFLPLIRELKNARIPVFLLPDNPGTHHGFIRIVERPQTRTIGAGGIPLEKANINNHPKVVAAIQEELDAGKKGDDLAEAIRKRFAYQEGEVRPISPLGTEEGFAEHASKVRGRNPDDDMY